MKHVAALVGVIGLFGFPVWIGWAYGDYVLAAVVFGWFLGFIALGHEAALQDIRKDGYVLEQAVDMTGKKRWRVGVVDAPPDPRPTPARKRR